MTTAFFPDTTVLINFEILDRWDLLTELVKSGAAWVASVEDECRGWVSNYASIHSNAAMLFGTAVRPAPAEQIDIRIARDELSDPADDHPYKHLGEAETIVIIQTRFVGSRFITDDRGAYAAATAQGIRCYGTGDLLLVAESRSLISPDERTIYLAALKADDRFPQSYYV